MHKMFYNQNITPISSNYFLAGTSPNAKILKSIDDGLNWTDKGTLGKGNPNCFSYINSSNVWYGTSTGYVCNYIGDAFIKVSNYQINSIYTNISNDMALLGDSNGDFYYTPISDFNGWSLQYSLGYSINHIRYDSILGTLLFTSNGIYSHDGVTLTLRQSGNFTCAIYDSVNGFIYAGTTNGHVYRNTTINDFSIWTDLGNKTMGGGGITSMCLNEGRIIYSSGSNGNTWYTDDSFGIVNFTGYSTDGIINSIVVISSTILAIGVGTGHIWRSTNNGLTITDIGQQYSQTSINCLLSV